MVRLEACFLLLAVARCGGASAPGEPGGTPSRSVTQGGPQDIGQFRKIVADGKVPSVTLLDEAAFFNEHALDLPPADCGESLCFHPLLAVAPRFSGENWTMAFVAMNTPVDPAQLTVGPRHLILVVEKSTEVAPVLSLQRVVGALLLALQSSDRVTLISADDSPRVLTLAGHIQDLSGAEITQPGPMDVTHPVDLYGALVLAYQVAITPELAGRAPQVLLLTSGVAGGGGVGQVAAFEGLGQELAKKGVVVSAFGMGAGFQRDIPRALSDATSGNFYFVESANDLANAITIAARTGFVPLARDLRLVVAASPGYRVGTIYGGARVRTTEAEAFLEIPTAFIGARTGAMDVMTGRRGGGGGFFVELVADRPPGSAPVAAASAFTLTASYQDQVSGQPRTREVTVSTPLGVGNNPQTPAPFFSDSTRAKPFMMLDMYGAIRSAVSLYQSGSCGSALGIEEMMRDSYQRWKKLYDDPDIDADHTLLQDLTAVIRKECDSMVVRPVAVPAACFSF
jgi:Ca-activated chloride channel homolog